MHYVYMSIHLTYDVGSTWEATLRSLGCFEGWWDLPQAEDKSPYKGTKRHGMVHKSENRENTVTSST